MVDAPSVTGDEVRFVVLDDGEIVVEAGAAADPSPLAAGLSLTPPLRVEAVRRRGSTWAVGASTITVARLSPLLRGDEIEVVWDGVERSVRVDGEPSFGTVPELEELAAARHRTWVARATRLRDRDWEIEIGPL